MTTLQVEQHERTLLVRLNRPDKLNAISPEMFRELRQLFLDATADSEVGAIVITGSGRAFSSGADLRTFETLQNKAAYQAQLELVAGAFRAAEECRVPVVAAVNGLALAGGLEILLFCDFVIAAPCAIFSFSEVGVGLQPVYGLLRGPAVMGRNWTRYLAYTGERICAQTAAAIGLVQRIVPASQLLDTAMHVARTIALQPPAAVAEGKRLANHFCVNAYIGDDEKVTDAIRTAERLFDSAEHKHAVNRFFVDRKKRQ
jgi:enoyl-CoA hydratase/carnithine racemase